MIRKLGSMLIVLGMFIAGFQILGLNESSAVAEEVSLKPSLNLGARTYDHYCTACHGTKGEGNGFNAENLYVKPANHSDASLMSTRSDAVLFNAINMGGTGISKSSLMPPWGAVIGDTRIASLIIKLRKMCNCEAIDGG